MSHPFDFMPLRKKLTRSNRLDPFSDGIFAIVVTLLVLDLHLPHLTGTSGEFLTELRNTLPNIFSFVLGFILICTFWVSHHTFFDLVVKTDLNLIWLNIFTLMCVCFLPFPVAVLGGFPHEPFAIVLLGVAHMITGLIFCIMISYAIHKEGMLSDEVDISSVQKIVKFALIGICTILIPIAVAFVNTIVAASIYFCIAFSYIFIVRLVKLKDKAGEDLGE